MDSPRVKVNETATETGPSARPHLPPRRVAPLGGAELPGILRRRRRACLAIGEVHSGCCTLMLRGDQFVATINGTGRNRGSSKRVGARTPCAG
jgi:hypothetical protein